MGSPTLALAADPVVVRVEDVGIVGDHVVPHAEVRPAADRR